MLRARTATMCRSPLFEVSLGAELRARVADARAAVPPPQPGPQRPAASSRLSSTTANQES